MDVNIHFPRQGLENSSCNALRNLLTQSHHHFKRNLITCLLLEKKTPYRQSLNKTRGKKKQRIDPDFLSNHSFLKVSITATSEHSCMAARPSKYPQKMLEFLLFTLRGYYYFLSQLVSVWNLTSSARVLFLTFHCYNGLYQYLERKLEGKVVGQK